MTLSLRRRGEGKLSGQGIPLKLKLKAGAKGLTVVLLKPKWVLVAVGWTAVVVGVMLWIFNLNLLAYIWFGSGLPVSEKLAFFLRGYGALVTNFDSAGAATLLTFGILMGINLALLGFVITKKRQDLAGQGGKSGLALTAGIIGAGCAACGTGILGPVLSVVGASSSIALVKTAGVVANVLGIGLVLYSIYGLGQRAATLAAAENLN